ncbi:hypothetical protein [Amycolatopsis magusensis]|uniref:Secreted protein n=1 Tax=Amycolatopsis magusensis TaxID=882444 RepID=A0ABS4PLG4_9PSEU|nr:hypothetical protein [Amycolatopsis magusensis]MBP2180269.1 hypothetical protein [Amycolatopsis magusensis]MDI5975825.1 hypothetical protein [Amycolatopsis magusensis]UJW33744.1 hypothetical protein L3Q67_08235 [Saccharothrix sp. AJ9571]
MLYLLAAIGALTVAVVLWRTFGAPRPGVPSSQPRVAPDDDPDFLRGLSEQHRKRSRDDDEK